MEIWMKSVVQPIKLVYKSAYISVRLTGCFEVYGLSITLGLAEGISH